MIRGNYHSWRQSEQCGTYLLLCCWVIGLGCPAKCTSLQCLKSFELALKGLQANSKEHLPLPIKHLAALQAGSLMLRLKAVILDPVRSSQ